MQTRGIQQASYISGCTACMQYRPGASNAFESKVKHSHTQTRFNTNTFKPSIVSVLMRSIAFDFAFERVCIRSCLPLCATAFCFACERDRNAFEVYVAPGQYCM